MTIPSEILLPRPPESLDKATSAYINELIYKLQEAYQQLATATNGTYLYANPDTTTTIQQGVWLPKLQRITTPGTGTYTYQIGYSVRKGLMTHVFFDISWSAMSGAGDIYVQLPYKVRKSSQKPFICAISVDSLTITGSYVVGVAIPDTYRLEVWQITSAGASARLSLPTSGKIAGSMIYIGQDEEEG